MNPFNLNGSFAQTSASIGDAMGGFLNGLAGNGWDDLTNAGNGSNGYKGLLEQTECDKFANYTTKGLLGVSGFAAVTAGGLMMAGFDPWLGKIAIHGPHAGGPHQYWHLQFMLRTGASVTKHARWRLPKLPGFLDDYGIW